MTEDREVLNLRIGRLFVRVASGFALSGDLLASGEFDTSGIDWNDAQNSLPPCMFAAGLGTQEGRPIVCLRQGIPKYDEYSGLIVERIMRQVSDLSGSGHGKRHISILKHVKQQIVKQLRKMQTKQSWGIAEGAEGFVSTESIERMLFKPTGHLLGKSCMAPNSQWPGWSHTTLPTLSKFRPIDWDLAILATFAQIALRLQV
jgi:hypothetical protein